MFSTRFIKNSAKSLLSHQQRSYVVVASCKTPYDTSSSKFDGATEAERLNTKAMFESNVLTYMYALQPRLMTEEYKQEVVDKIKKQWKTDKLGEAKDIDNMDIGAMIDEKVVEYDDDEASMILGDEFAEELGHFFKFKPKMSIASTDAMMYLNKNFYQEQIERRSVAILEYAYKNKNLLRK